MAQIKISQLSTGTPKGTDLTPATDPTDLSSATTGTTKKYVRSDELNFYLQSQGLTTYSAVLCASTIGFTVTYANGASGVGATLTNAGTQAVFSVDGISPSVSSRVLIKNQSSTFQNGIYTVTNVGSISTNWVLTRASDFDQAAEIIQYAVVLVDSGTVQANELWQEIGAGPFTIGTTPITFAQYATANSSNAVLLNPGANQTINGNFTLKAFNLTASNIILAGNSTAPLSGIQNLTVGPIGSSGINAVFSYNNSSNYADFFGYKSASNVIGVQSAIGNAEPILSLTGLGDDGTQFTIGGSIKLSSSGTVSNGIVPSSWVFQTANTSGVLTTGMTLSNAQVLTLANALPVASGGTGITSFGTGVATALGQNVTGSGGMALKTSPVFVTPTLGAASATSINFGGASLSTYSGLTSWTPVFTFATPGDLSVVYTVQGGSYTRTGNVVTATFQISCTPTFTTASSTFQITGLPFTSNSATGNVAVGALIISSIGLPVGKTFGSLFLGSNSSVINIYASGTATAVTPLAATNFTTGVAVIIAGSLTYLV